MPQTQTRTPQTFAMSELHPLNQLSAAPDSRIRASARSKEEIMDSRSDITCCADLLDCHRRAASTAGSNSAMSSNGEGPRTASSAYSSFLSSFGEICAPATKYHHTTATARTSKALYLHNPGRTADHLRTESHTNAICNAAYYNITPSSLIRGRLAAGGTMTIVNNEIKL